MVYTQVFLNNLRLAVLSSMLWVTCWAAAFFGSNAAIELSNRPENPTDNPVTEWQVSVTALALTIAVVSSHIPKLISYLMECGTDFQSVFDSGTRKSEGTHYFRLGYSSVLLFSALILAWNGISETNEPHQIITATFISYSWQFVHIIALIWCAQIIFSWPEEVRSSTRLDGPNKKITN